jgi:hypothetical protein
MTLTHLAVVLGAVTFYGVSFWCLMVMNRRRKRSWENYCSRRGRR